jgi:hypothetical protein
MEEHSHLYVECKNVGCRQPIWLHRSSPLGTYSGLPETPEDALSKIWTCPECVHAFDYTRQDHRRRSFPQPDPYQLGQLIVGTVEFSCATEKCGVLVQIHKPMAIETTHTRWRETANATAWTIDAHCPNGHPVTIVPNDYQTDIRGWPGLPYL